MRPELATEEVECLCVAVIGMINASATGLAPFKPALRRRVVYAAALHALGAPLDPDTDGSP
jgi:hypothetical protein